jgi:hypothetical protein
MSVPDVIQFPDTTNDTLDRAGHDVLARLQHAARIAEQNTQQAMSMARQAALQLRAAEDKVAKIEREIRSYQERAERAEDWLRRISQEIDKTFIASRPQQSQPEDYAPWTARSRRLGATYDQG